MNIECAAMIMACEHIRLPAGQRPAGIHTAPIVPAADELATQIDGAVGPVGGNPTGRAGTRIKEGVLARGSRLNPTAPTGAWRAGLLTSHPNAAYRACHSGSSLCQIIISTVDVTNDFDKVPVTGWRVAQPGAIDAGLAAGIRNQPVEIP